VPRKRNNSRGFTLIEVILAFSILAVAMAVLALVEISNARNSSALKQRDIAFARGQAMMERIMRLPFGSPNSPPLSGSDLDRLFGSDDDAQAISLTQLQQRDTNGDGTIDQEPFRFQLEGVEDAGTWEVRVDSDLDGNGLIEATVAGVPTREGRGDLLRIEILHNGRAVLKTLRSRSPQERDDAEGLG